MKPKSKNQRKVNSPAATVPPPDIIISLGENVINSFLAEHFIANPEFYTRDTTPIWQTQLPPDPIDCPNVARKFMIFGKVLSPGVTVDLAPTLNAYGNAGDSKRFLAWWAVNWACKPNSLTKTPPNIVVKASILANFQFTRRYDSNGNPNTDPNNVWSLDYQFEVVVGAFLSIVTDAITKQSYLKATDWQITVVSKSVDSNGQAVPSAGDRIGVSSTDPACESELKNLREKITDLFDFGANYALAQLSSSVVQTLPLPPLTNLINSVNLIYDELTIANKAVSVSAWAQPTQSFLDSRVSLESSIDSLNRTFDKDLVQKIGSSAPADVKKLIPWMEENIPSYAELRAQNKARLQRARGKRLSRRRNRVTASDLIQLSTDGTIFDIIAKKYLNYHKEAEKVIISVDASVLGFGASGVVGVGYNVTLDNASGGIGGSSNTGLIFMGCNVDISAWGYAQVILESPCGDEPLPAVQIGVRLAGPLQANIEADTTDYDINNQTISLLKVKGQFSDFPGLQVIGLPDPLSKILNTVISAATSFLFESFLNSVLDLLTFYIVSIPVKIPKTNVVINIENFNVGIPNGQGPLVITVQPTFKKD